MRRCAPGVGTAVGLLCAVALAGAPHPARAETVSPSVPSPSASTPAAQGSSTPAPTSLDEVPQVEGGRTGTFVALGAAGAVALGAGLTVGLWRRRED